MAEESFEDTAEASINTVEDSPYKNLQAFGDFLKVDASKEIEMTTNIIDGILAKFEEFCTVMELVRMESKDLLFTTLPVLHERCHQLQPIFAQVDLLEKFINVVRKSIDDAEEKVKAAEKELGNRGLKKILNTVSVPKFLSWNKDANPNTEVRSPLSFASPKSFKTDDYFDPIEQKSFSYNSEITQ